MRSPLLGTPSSNHSKVIIEDCLMVGVYLTLILGLAAILGPLVMGQQVLESSKALFGRTDKRKTH